MALVKVTTRKHADTPTVTQLLDDADHSQNGVIKALRRQFRSDELAEFVVEAHEPEAAPKSRAKSGS